EKDLNRVGDAFGMLRSRDAAEAIPDLLNYPHLTISQRVYLIKSYNNYLLDPPISLVPVQKYLDAHQDAPAQVKLAALEVLTMPGQPKNGKLEELALALLDQNDSAFRLSLIQAIENGRLAKSAGRLMQVLADAKGLDTERIAAVKALRAFDYKEIDKEKDALKRTTTLIVRGGD